MGALVNIREMPESILPFFFNFMRKNCGKIKIYRKMWLSITPAALLLFVWTQGHTHTLLEGCRHNGPAGQGFAPKWISGLPPNNQGRGRVRETQPLHPSQWIWIESQPPMGFCPFLHKHSMAFVAELGTPSQSFFSPIFFLETCEKETLAHVRQHHSTCHH